MRSPAELPVALLGALLLLPVSVQAQVESQDDEIYASILAYQNEQWKSSAIRWRSQPPRIVIDPELLECRRAPNVVQEGTCSDHASLRRALDPKVLAELVKPGLASRALGPRSVRVVTEPSLDMDEVSLAFSDPVVSEAPGSRTVVVYACMRGFHPDGRSPPGRRPWINDLAYYLSRDIDRWRVVDRDVLFAAHW